MTAFADLAQATAWVFDLQKFGIKFGLSSTLSLLARLRLDYQEGRYIHVAGTNGKGSTCAMLKPSTGPGRRVGLFTSPHLVSFRERFHWWIGCPSARTTWCCWPRTTACGPPSRPSSATFFELATVMALLILPRNAGPCP